MFKFASIVAVLFLLSNIVYADPQKINIGGISIGKPQADGSYSWKNYDAIGDNMSSPFTQRVAISEDGSTIYAADAHELSSEDADVVSIGSIQKDGSILWKNYGAADQIPTEFVYDLFVKNDTLYMADRALVVKKNKDQKFKIYDTKDGLGDWVHKIYVDSENTIYAGTSGGVSIKKEGESKFTTYTTKDGLGSNYVEGLYVDGQTIYAATISHLGDIGGLSIGKPGKDGRIYWKSYTTASGLPSNDIMSVYVDNNHTIYLGVFEQGLFISKDGGLTWRHCEGLVGNLVTAITVKDNVIYVANDQHPIGSGTGGLSISKDGGQTWKNYTTDDGLYSNAIWGLAVDKNNNVYLGRQIDTIPFSNKICPDPKNFLAFLLKHKVDPQAQMASFGANESDWEYSNPTQAFPDPKQLSFLEAHEWVTDNDLDTQETQCDYQLLNEPDKKFTIKSNTSVVVIGHSPTKNPENWIQSSKVWTCGKITGKSSVDDCVLSYKEGMPPVRKLESFFMLHQGKFSQ
jgi:hypothetical protein